MHYTSPHAKVTAAFPILSSRLVPPFFLVFPDVLSDAWNSKLQKKKLVTYIFKNFLREKRSGRTSWGGVIITVTHLDNGIKDQKSRTNGPAPSHFGRQRFSELALAPFRNNQEFSYNCGEEEPDMLAHSHGAP